MKHLVVMLALLIPELWNALQVKPADGQAQPFQGFDLRKLAGVIDGNQTSAPNRIQLGIDYLIEEMAHPSQTRWGAGGGAIDTGSIRQSIIGAIAFPGAEMPSVLRCKRDMTSNELLRNYLTIALAETGAQDTISGLLKITTTESSGAIRLQAITALAQFMWPPAKTDVPKRLRDGETWHAIDSATARRITAILVNSLNDPYKGYQGLHDSEGASYYPIIEHARATLKRLGYRIVEVSKEGEISGWHVFDKNGHWIKDVPLKEPIRKAVGPTR